MKKSSNLNSKARSMRDRAQLVRAQSQLEKAKNSKLTKKQTFVSENYMMIARILKEEAVVAGSEPETKEEAEIAKIQAETRAIQSSIGEYKNDNIQDVDNQSIDPEDDQDDFSNPTPETAVDPSVKGIGETTDPAKDSMMMGGSIDPMTGAPIDTTKTPGALGRLYIMKKIYDRFLILIQIVDSNPDPEIKTLRDQIHESFDMYQMIVNNLKSHRDRIDDHIKDYYLLIKDFCQKLLDHFQQSK